jgi:NADPH:quinone reductase-like Zn-dependent oxidoreductase
VELKVERMHAVRLHGEGIDTLSLDEIEVPTPGAGEALVRVHAAGLTREELTWPTDRLPAIPSYELSGVVVEAPKESDLAAGDAVVALTPFDADGVAAELAVVPSVLLAPKPTELSHVEAASLPLAGLSAWQALFDHGRLEAGERVLVTGAVGGVGHLGLQLARWCGARVVAAVAPGAERLALELGANEILGETGSEPFDLVFDTTGGQAAADGARRLRNGSRFVSVVEEPADIPGGVSATYFVVEPNREQLGRILELAGSGEIRPLVDSAFALADARAAFERTEARGKRGKVVLRVAEEY